jgi:hypothetical protein
VSNRILYEDNTAALTSDALVLRGFTKIFGRPRRIPLSGVTTVHVRERSEFPNGQLPPFGITDDGVWYTRDRRRFRRHVAIELTFANGEKVGFTPAHASRLRDLLVQHNVKER